MHGTAESNADCRLSHKLQFKCFIQGPRDGSWWPFQHGQVCPSGFLHIQIFAFQLQNSKAKVKEESDKEEQKENTWHETFKNSTTTNMVIHNDGLITSE